MDLTEEFMNAYNKSVKEKLLRRLPVGKVDYSMMDQKINWTRECLDKIDKMKTFKEKCKYWNVNMYRMSRSEIEALPFDIQDRYIQSYVQYILYKTWIPALIVIVYFSVVITIAFMHWFR